MMMYLQPLILVALICVTGAFSSAVETKLLKLLFQDYDKMERPARVDSDTVDVNFLVYLRQVIDVNWYDYRLQWDPEQYKNITRIIVPIEKVWCPDILLHNSANDNFDPTFKVNVEIYADGELRWMPPGIFSSPCQMDIQFFPFDTQRCKLEFSSWTYDMSRINLTLPSQKADISSYILNGEWNLIDALAERHEKVKNNTTQVFVDATYTIIISRRPLFYLFNLVLPTVLISIIALLTFTLPVESGEKVTLSVMVLLSIIMFLNLVMEQLPSTSDAIPLLGLYFGASTMLLSVCVACSIMVLNLHFRTPATSTFPRWIRVWINGHLALILRMKRPKLEEAEEYKRRPTTAVTSDLALQSAAILLSDYNNDDEEDTAGQSKPSSGEDIKWRMRQCVREVRTITKKMEKSDEDAEVCEEWKFAASVIDRLCFWLFGANIVCTTVIILGFSAGPEKI